MGNKIEYIQTPLSWESLNDWDSHSVALWLALEKTGRGPVTEFGCGFGSTPRLDKYCKRNKRLFFSYETNAEWASKFNQVTVMNDYFNVHLSGEEWRQGVIFIDSSPGEMRRLLISKHANNGDVLVVHDSEPGANYVYNMADILSTFKYRLDYEPIGKPHTAIVSNFIDVTKWISQK